jgi:hypothetical protein
VENAETRDTTDGDGAGADDEPSLLQRLHSATGDRDAEAKELADRTDVDLDDAKEAVNRAHGNSPAPVTTEEEQATAEDAEQVERERST